MESSSIKLVIDEKSELSLRFDCWGKHFLQKKLTHLWLLCQPWIWSGVHRGSVGAAQRQQGWWHNHWTLGQIGFLFPFWFWFAVTFFFNALHSKGSPDRDFSQKLLFYNFNLSIYYWRIGFWSAFFCLISRFKKLSRHLPKRDRSRQGGVKNGSKILVLFSMTSYVTFYDITKAPLK